MRASCFATRSDDRYRLTIMVRALSGGFDDEAWVTQIAKPFIHDLGREIVWPVSIATLSGTTMMMRETTDHASPLAIERYSAGFRLPLLTTAAGRVYLAFCPAPAARHAHRRAGALRQGRRQAGTRQRGPGSPADLLRMLADIKTQGYAATSRTRRLVEEISVSVPVLLEDRVLACLTVRFGAAAVPLKTGIERFLPKLRQCAARISTSFSKQQAEAQLKGAPRTAA